jgi:hypothetical protein
MDLCGTVDWKKQKETNLLHHPMVADLDLEVVLAFFLTFFKTQPRVLYFIVV